MRGASRMGFFRQGRREGSRAKAPPRFRGAGAAGKEGFGREALGGPAQGKRPPFSARNSTKRGRQ